MASRLLTTLDAFFHRSTPGYLIFFVTPYCNCRCRMCFNHAVIADAANRKTLDISEIERIAARFPHLHHVNFSGGEPFLRRDFRDIPALFYRHSGTRFFACPTNSSLPEEIEAVVDHICRTCPGAWIRVTQSLDGIGADHDAIRGRAGLFDKVVELNRRLTFLRARRANLSVGIAMVMSRFNAGREHEILEYACEHLHFSDFGALFVRGDTQHPEAREVETRAYVDFVECCRKTISRHAHRHGITARLFSAITAAATDLLKISIHQDRFVTPCRAGRNMAVLDDEGEVFPCEILEHYIQSGRAPRLTSARFGNLRDFDYDIRKVLATEAAREAIAYIRDSRCYCSFECAMSVNVLYSPRLWPRVAARLWRP